MIRSKQLLIATGLSFAIVLSIVTPDAQAGWHHAPVQQKGHASSGGSCGGSSGGSSGHSSGGLVRNLLSSLHHHHWNKVRVYHSGHLSSGGSSGGTVYLHRVPRRLYYAPEAVAPTPKAAKEKAAEETPAKEKATEETPAEEKKAASATPGGRAVFVVQVPEDARVYINDRLTETPGTVRHYVSYGLEPGFRYRYQVRVEITRNGKLVQETQTVKLQSGQTERIAFNTLDKPAAVVTTLILQVPEGANVTLAGKQLPRGKATRTFQTTSLAKGETWTDYPLQVVYETKGQTRTILRNITLTAGKTHTFNLGSEEPQVANLR